MTVDLLDRQARDRAAQQAWAALPHGGREHVTLRITCANGHHVATIYDTVAGRVFVAPVRAHAHGDRDLPDAPHGDRRPQQWFDLLVDADPLPDDPLPAWCDCGPRTLSRHAVLAWLRAGEHHVIID